MTAWVLRVLLVVAGITAPLVGLVPRIGTLAPAEQIAYVAWDDAATEGAVEIIDLRHRLYVERFRVFGRIDDLSWSPDGETLYFAPFRAEVIRRDIAALDVRSGRLRWLTDSTVPDATTDFNTPDVSPDGTRLAVMVYVDELTGWDIAIFDMATGDLTPFYASALDEGRPAWSPDGTRLAVQSSGAFAPAEIRVIAVDDGAVIWGIGGYAPSWSPDGERIVYVDSGTTILNTDLYTAYIGDTRGLTFADYDQYDSNPAWSPDGTRIVLTVGARGSGQQLLVIDAGGGNPRQITHRPGSVDHLAPAWRP